MFDAETGIPRGVMTLNAPMQTVGAVNPGFRMVYLDQETFQALDYDQYVMDLRHQTGTLSLTIIIIITL